MKIISTLLFIMLSINGFSQIYFYPYGENSSYTKASMQDGLNKLKSTTTYVYLGPLDQTSRERLNSIFQEYWKITKFIIVGRDSDIYHSNKTKYSYLSVQNERDSHYSSQYGQSVASYDYLRLWMDGGKDSKGHTTQYVYADLLLSEYYKNDFPQKDYGLVINYIQLLQKNLEAKVVITKPMEFNEYTKANNAELKNLSTATLYVPDFIMMKASMNAFSGGIKLTPYTAKEFMGNYNYPYKVVSAEELSELILNKEKPIYYVMHEAAHQEKYVYIVNGSTGEVIYSTSSMEGISIKADDINEIEQAVKKASK